MREQTEERVATFTANKRRISRAYGHKRVTYKALAGVTDMLVDYLQRAKVRADALEQRITAAAGFDTARRLSIDRLRLASGDRVLIVGAGTGLDLDFLPSKVHVTAIDVTPAMLKHLERRAAGTAQSVTARICTSTR